VLKLAAESGRKHELAVENGMNRANRNSALSFGEWCLIAPIVGSVFSHDEQQFAPIEQLSR